MQNTAFKTRLASDKGKFDCPGAVCTARRRKKTYSRVINAETGAFLPYEFGRCDKPSCGYENIPQKADLIRLGILGSQGSKLGDQMPQYPQNAVKSAEKPQPVIYLEHDYEAIKHTLDPDLYQENEFAQAIYRISGCPWELLVDVFKAYGVGTATKGPLKGSPIFYRYDADKRIYPGSIIAYDKQAKKRTKNGAPIISNSSIALDKRGKESKPLYFGTHRIKPPVGRKIGLVESPKTALIAALYEPTFIWVATGGLSLFAPNQNGHIRMAPLKEHPIIVFPDADAYKDRLNAHGKPQKGWVSLSEEWKKQGYTISLSSKVLNFSRTHKSRQKADLADILLLDRFA